MAKSILEFDGEFDETKLRTFLASSERERHFGRPVPIFDGQPFRVIYEKGAKGPYAVYSHSSLDRYILRRSAADARMSATDCYAFTIMDSGEMTVRQANQTIGVGAGQCCLIPMQHPYVVDQLPPRSGGSYRSLYTFIPTHVLPAFRSLTRELRVLHADPEELQRIKRLMELLLQDAADLQLQTCRSIFREITDRVNSLQLSPSERAGKTAANDDVWSEAMTYIDAHFSDPNLDLDRMSVALGKSKRTLNYAFSDHGMTFSAALWGARLAALREWLATPSMMTIPIRQLSYAAGFKTSAHMSTKFKAHMRCSPRDFRSAAQASGARRVDEHKTN